jgi:hypothetical protein
MDVMIQFPTALPHISANDDVRSRQQAHEIHARELDSSYVPE